MAALMCTTVYVGNLNFKTTSEDLVNFFEGAEIGNVVNVDLKKHAADGQSKGWALVDFASAEDASNCADQLNGALLDDRLLTIRLDRKSMPMGQGNGGMGGGMGYNNNGGAGGRNNGGGAAPMKEFAPSNRVYVGNLPWVADDAALMAAFSMYNPISATVVYGRDGRSRGYGIVEFSTVDEAGMAIDGMNQSKFNGERPMNVRYDVGKAIPDSQKAGFQRNYDDTLYVGNLPWGVTWQQLKDLFQDYNPEYADVKMGPDGRSRGWGTVRFATGEDANAAIAQFDGYELIGRNGPRSIEVRKDRGPTRKD